MYLPVFCPVSLHRRYEAVHKKRHFDQAMCLLPPTPSWWASQKSHTLLGREEPAVLKEDKLSPALNSKKIIFMWGIMQGQFARPLFQNRCRNGFQNLQVV